MSQKQQIASHDAGVAPGGELAELAGSFEQEQRPSFKTVTPKPLKDFPLTTGAGTFVPASSVFGFRLLALLAKGEAPASKNVFLSPLSLSLALAMVMDGAGSATRTPMQKALGYKPSDSPSAIDADVKAFLARYQGKQISPGVAAAIASALWPNTSLPPNLGHLAPTYAAHAQQTFGASVRAVDFASASGAQQVNAWTKEHTRGKIVSILPNIAMPSAALVLTNAVYFKAKWNQSFQAENTQPGSFTLGSGQKVTLPMMRQTDHFSYQKGSGFQALQLPYDDGRFSLHILLPDAGVGLQTFAQKQLASAAQWNQYLTHFTNAKVALKLPRFKLEYDAGELVPSLSALGMASVFDSHADFRPMGYRAAFVNSVRHKTTLVVDEEGSEATAVTAIPMVGSAMHRPEQIVSFVVDRPFACAIRDNATGALLFVGLIAAPETV